MDFQTFKLMPKAELHVHLEGSLRVGTLLELAREHSDHPFSQWSEEHFRQQCQTHSFEAFLNLFINGYRLLHKEAHFQRVTEELLADLQEQGVTHAQILYSPGVYTQKLGVDIKTIHEGIARGLRQFPNLKACFILDTVLNLGLPFMTEDLRHGLAHRPDFLRGFSVGGGVPDLDMQEMLPVFHEASEAGLFCVAHAGEVDGYENIDILLAETDVLRIAHGCAAALSERTLWELSRRNVMVDVCTTSNLRTGTVKSLDVHPLRSFLAHGVPVSLNTDDPVYFQADLYGEYQAAAVLMGMDDPSLAALMEASLEAFKKATPDLF